MAESALAAILFSLAVAAVAPLLRVGFIGLPLLPAKPACEVTIEVPHGALKR